MIKLRKFKRYIDKGKSEEILSFVNETRSNYPYSQRVYSEKDTGNVYLILYQQRIAGFCEAEITNTCLEVPDTTTLYLHELHVCEAGKRKGIGKSTISHLLDLDLPIELVVANDNTAMRSLISKFSAVIKYEPSNVKTYVIYPENRGRGA
ncbi:GNAT family N-acetyltransferase [Marinobacter sp. HN1S83]|uniref:GNAT family N-acetyltransferase n=1 Tax=Marinobacter sp. HN1S83 TaxID=3382301 RepID=UPI00387B6923